MNNGTRNSLLFAAGSLALGGSLAAQTAPSDVEILAELQRPQRPNIVFLLADDVGFSDLGAYGSEIATPNLDRLAASGVAFSNFHTAPSCAPSRAMLLTGVNSHLAGVPNIPEALPAEQRGEENYDGVINLRVATVASRLNEAGYHTYMTGKWHLGTDPAQLPYNRGFDQTLSMGDTGADNYLQRTYLPIYDRPFWTRNGVETDLEEPFYTSELFVDEMIEFIDSNLGDGQPFFSYVSFMAVHVPVQAPREFTELYQDTYTGGWEEVRASRHQGAIDAGAVPEGTQRLTHDFIEDWDSLSPGEQEFAARRMAVYAGMLTAMDHHIGRLIAYLEEVGELDNTVFIFTSDNGPESLFVPDRVFEQQGYSVEIDTLGEIGSATFIGPDFANAAASPLSYYKWYTGEGGLRVPFIVSGPGVAARDVFTVASAHAIDVTPTILALAGVDSGGDRFGGRPVEPITGRDLGPILRGTAEQVYGPEDYVGYEIAGNAALFNQQYKIVLNRGPLGDSQWAMFDIINDPGETQDLSAENPAQFQRMLNSYQRYARENGVLPVPQNYTQHGEINLQNIRGALGESFLAVLLTLIAVGGITLLAVQRKRPARHDCS